MIKQRTFGIFYALIFTVSASAIAETIPAELQHDLMRLNLARPPVLTKGFLTVSLNFERIEMLQAKSISETVCTSYYGLDSEKRAWAEGKIKEVRVANADVTQGFVFKGGDSTCEAMANLIDDENFINEKLEAKEFEPIKP
ncbi:hypothetical protein QM637_16090 [Pantoea allii]|uniref:hypothetical protein n=1 Tax=Pantoea allii TaxID=574096 RepID=UPI0024B753B2|nr:hypothetical protein [Pantoea allii]MDJ0037337.1 hypothetical protein [Pantoea allii]